MSDYYFYKGELYSSDELAHHGVKGMKWGVRRYQNKDGSLTEKGVKRYAQKGYAKDSLKSNKTSIGKAYDRLTGAHKINAKYKYESASKKRNEQRAEKYLKERDKQKSISRKKAAKVAAKGAVKSAKILNKVGKAYLTDQIFFGGTGTKLAKETVMATGRAAVTAYTMARGGYDIKWYDKQGRRVG